MTPAGTRRRRSRVVVGALVTMVVALTAVAGPAVADSYDPQRRDAEARLNQATQAADAIAASIATLTNQLAQAESDLQATQARLPAAQAELAAAQQTLERTQREALLIASQLQDAQAEETSITTTIGVDAAKTEQAHTAVGEMAREAYQGGTAATGLAFVFGAKTTQDFVDQYVMVATSLRVETAALDQLHQIGAEHLNDQARLTAVKDRVAALKAAADERVAEAAAATAVATARQAEIQNLIAAQTTQQATVTAMKAQAEAEQVTIDAKRTAIATELAGIIAQQRAAQAAAAQSATCMPGVAGAAGGSLPTRIGPFQGEQITNAAQIIIAANDLGIGVRGQVIGVMTAIGESTLINVNFGDVAGPDSRGLLQQRANGAWGSYADRMNPRIAATNFFKALLRVPGWQTMPPTLAAHAVQGNAVASYYSPFWNDAVLVVGTLGGYPNLVCQ